MAGLGHQYAEIADANVDADSPLDETLMKDGIRDNLTALRNIANLGGSVFTVFAGDGSDGAGPTGAGDTAVGTAGKQYTNWNIGSTAQTLSASGGQSYYKIGVTGTFTLSSGSLTVTGDGEAGGAAGASVGAAGTAGTSKLRDGFGEGTGGGGGSGGDHNHSVTGSGAGGAGGTVLAQTAAAGGVGLTTDGPGNNGSAGVAALTNFPGWYLHYGHMRGACGGGGGSKGAVAGLASGDGGAGGGGGPLLIIECDTLNFSGGSIVASGAAGANGAANAAGGGAGGGGAGGTVIIIARTITSSAGTITTAGGAGGTGGAASPNQPGGNGGAGGAGRSQVVEIPD